jgi:hypothetical protein
MSKPSYVSISRDPFAREEIVRELVPTRAGCAWCGNNNRNRLFRYGVETDSGRQHWDSECFDSIQCRNNYYN